MRLSARLGAVVAFSLAVACGGGDSSGPSDPQPAALSVAVGNNQSATVGTAVAVAPAVLVKDQNGDPIAGVLVSFAVAGGNGSLTGTAVTTGANGVAAVGSWTLPTLVGSYQMTASVADLPVLIFSATATAGAPAALVLATAPSGTATSGAAFGTQPAVRLEDLFGNVVPQAGVTVTAAIA